ncbi:MAG TPA: hemolysin III family protein [Candidatus Nanopelagicales bacterium]|nr:hemolysin III family protein [Candidatus Nanopelagicales bacterium]
MLPTPTRKPHLRGWLHAAMVPATLAAGVALLVLAPTGAAKLALAVYLVTAVLLFTVSAVYHRFSWGPRVEGVLKRLDHANIFLIIAGSYTPFAVLLLEPGPARTLLWLVWAGALAGVAFRVFWVGAPRWLYVPVYLALGWTAVFFLPSFLRGGGIVVLVLIIIGGLLYSTGGVVYALKRPNPWPRWFGFHEVFHAFTLGGFLAQFAAVSIVVAALR